MDDKWVDMAGEERNAGHGEGVTERWQESQPFGSQLTVSATAPSPAEAPRH